MSIELTAEQAAALTTKLETATDANSITWEMRNPGNAESGYLAHDLVTPGIRYDLNPTDLTVYNSGIAMWTTSADMTALRAKVVTQIETANAAVLNSILS